MKIVFFSAGKKRNRFYRPSRQAFSLVEIVLALGIATFGILVIVALLPAGIKSTNDSLEETGAINVLSEVISDRQATPAYLVSKVYGLPALTNTTLVTPTSNNFGITEGNQFSTQLTQSRYRVDYVINPPTSKTLAPYQAWFKVSWPAPSPNPAGYVEGMVTFPQP